MTRSLFVLLAALVAAAIATAASGCQDASADARLDAVATEALPYYADGDFTPQWFAPGTVPADFHTVPAFSLTDQDGQTITEADLDGRITVANFFFTACPGICPMTTANMKRVQTAFAGDDGVALLSHSVTPDADSVAALHAFGERMGALAGQWHLVTGSRDAVYALGKTAYFADDDLGETMARADAAFTHTGSFFLVDGRRHIRGVYNGMNSAAVTQLIEDVQALQREPA